MVAVTPISSLLAGIAQSRGEISDVPRTAAGGNVAAAAVQLKANEAALLVQSTTLARTLESEQRVLDILV